MLQRGQEERTLRTVGGLEIARPALLTRDMLRPSDIKLVEIAKDAMRGSFNPVEEIHVGCAAVLTDGSFHDGANSRAFFVERHMHAEEIMVVKMQQSGVLTLGPDGKFSKGIAAVAVISSYVNNGNEEPKFICDTCSKMFLNIAERSPGPIPTDTRIILSNTEMTGFYVVEKVSMLFPMRNIPHGEIVIEHKE